MLPETRVGSYKPPRIYEDGCGHRLTERRERVKRGEGQGWGEWVVRRGGMGEIRRINLGS